MGSVDPEQTASGGATFFLISPGSWSDLRVRVCNSFEPLRYNCINDNIKTQTLHRFVSYKLSEPPLDHMSWNCSSVRSMLKDIFQLGWKDRFRHTSFNLVLSYCLRTTGCILSFQLAILETYQVGNTITPTWFADRSVPVYFS